MEFTMISLGCSKNQVDSELIASILIKDGYKFTSNIEQAGIIIVNTCCFIDSAKEESIEVVLQASQYKEFGHCKYLIMCGCLGQRYSEELMKEMPEIDGIVGTGEINNICMVIEKIKNGQRAIQVKNINNTYCENIERTRLFSKHYDYIKISEGCDNYCSYCIIPKVRGKYRSRRIENIVEEAKLLVRKGTKEIILIAQDTSRYGIDIYGEKKLHVLLDKLNEIDGLEWIRLQYLYPESFSEQLIKSIKRNDKVVKYVDIPIQHINDRILKRMNRKATKNTIIKLINTLREEINDIVIRTTLIVGFPGETKKEFNELYEFVKQFKFDRLGAFIYSKEEGTKAFELSGQIDKEIKKERYQKIMELQKSISYNKNSRKLNKLYKIIIDNKIDNENIYIGRTYMDSPEIDGVIYLYSKQKLHDGQFVYARITDFLEYDLKGEIVNEFS